MPGYGVNDVQETSGGYSPNDVLADQKKPEGGFAPAVKKATGQAVKSIGQLASDYIPGVSKDNAVSKYGQSVIDANPTVVHGFSDVPDNKIKTLTEGAGMAAGSVGGVLATQALGGGLQLVPNPIVKAIGKGISKYGPWAAMTIPAYGEIREQQINEDPGMEHSAKGKLSALSGAGAVGAIESKFGPESWASSAFTKEGRKKIAEAFAAKTLPGAVAKGGVRGALVEGAEELVQSPIQQIAAFQDPTTRKNLEETAFGGFMGAVGGGAFGGGVGAASRLSGQGEAQVAQQQGQPTEDQTRLLGEQEAIQTPSGYAENADELAKAQAHAANIYAERDAFEQDQMERNGLNPANIQAEFGEDITAQPVPSEISRQQFVNNMPPPSYLEWAQNMDIADFISGFPIRSADRSMTLASILRGPFADQVKEQAAERLWNLGQQSRIPTPESLPADAGPIAKAAAMGTVTGAVQTNQYGMHVQPDMPQKGFGNGATDQGGKVSPMVAQGDQSQGANLSGSGSIAQPDLSSGLAGRSGGTGIPGATDGSAVSVGDAGVQGVEWFRSLSDNVRTASADLARIDARIAEIEANTPINPQSLAKQANEIQRLAEYKEQLLQIGATQEAADVVTRYNQVTTPATTLPESAPAPVTQLAQPTMGSESEKPVTSAPSQIKPIPDQPITQPGKSITQRGENIVVLGYPREALENARSTLHANAVIDQKGQAIFRAGTDMNALKEALNPGTAYIPEANALKAEDFPMYVKGGKFSQARAHTFSKKFGAKSFDNKQEADVYAEALRNGEGGNWVAKKHLGKWRAVVGESNAQDAGKTEAYEAEAIDDQGVYGGKGQPEAMGESESAMVPAVPASATESASQGVAQTKKVSNNLIRRIQQLGGINTRYLRDVTGEDNARRFAPGLFRERKQGKGGTIQGYGLDELANILSAEGFPINLSDDTDIDGVNQLTGLIQSAINGRIVLNHAGLSKSMQDDGMASRREALKEEIENLGGTYARNASTKRLEEAVAALRAKASILEQELPLEAAALSDSMGDELVARTVTGNEAMLALGFTEEEINEINANYRKNQETTKGATEEGNGTGATEGKDQGFGLTGETAEEVRAKEAARISKEKAEADRIKADEQPFVMTGSDRVADQMAARGQQDIFSQPDNKQPATPTTTRDTVSLSGAEDKKPATSTETPAGQPAATTEATPAVNQKVTTEPVAKIEDFGDKIGGSRKDMAKAMRKEWSDDEIGQNPLSKIWPKSEVDAIEDKFIAAFAHAARDEVPSKPRKAYLVKGWVEKVKMLRGLASKALDGKITKDRFVDLLDASAGLKHFASRVRLLEAIDRAHWGRIGKVEEYPDAFTYDADGKQEPRPQVSVEIDDRRNRFQAKTLDDALPSILEKLGAKTQEKAMQFEVRGRVGRYAINKKGDPLYRKLSQNFDTSKDAFDYIKTNYSDLVAGWENVKESDNVKETDVRSGENRPRHAKDWRGGKDATQQQFQDSFGFRGVEWGNWVSQGKNDKERQGMLNQAYDALMDLSDIIGIPPKAISLNGSLGLGFGSRGHGWASAHFEPDTLVINLTKTRGAGSLGHEWFHALDNYFQLKRGKPASAKQEDWFVTYAPENYYVHKASGQKIPARAFEKMISGESVDGRHLLPRYRNPEQWELKEGVRPEVGEAFADLVNALNDSPMAKRASLIDKGKSGGYWSRIIERGARSFENYLIHKMGLDGYHNDYLANVRRIEDFGRDHGRYPYLLDSEIEPVAKAFDNLFATVQTKETDQGVVMFSRRIHGNNPNAHDYIVPETPEFAENMSGDLAYTPRSAEANGFEQLPIRLTVGVAREAHRGFGIMHMADNAKRDTFRKPPQVTDDEAENFARQVAAVARTFQSVYHEHGNRYILVSPKTTDALAVERKTDAFTGEEFYSAVTLVPAKNRHKWGKPVWAGRVDFPVDRALQPRASVPSSDKETQQSDRQPQRNQTSHFDFSKIEEDRQPRKVPVTVKKRRAYTAKDEKFSRRPAREDKPTSSTPAYTEPADKADVAAVDKLNQTLRNYFGSDDYGVVLQPGRNAGLSHADQEAIRAAFRTRVIQVVSKPGGRDAFNGFSIPGVDAIFVNANTDIGFINIAGHELLHDLKRRSPTLYAYYAENAKPYLKNLPAYQARLNAKLQSGESLYDSESALEELLADFMGDSLSDPAFLQQMADRNPSKFKQFVNAVRLWLSGVASKLRGLGSSQHISDVKALQKYLADVLDAYAEGKEIAGVSAPKFQRVYHGTPHIWAPEPGFPHGRPRLDKMGTGEGAQAYGWGLYIAEAEEVGAGYQKTLSGMLPSGWSDKYPESARAYIRGIVGDVSRGEVTPEQAARYVYNANSNMRDYQQATLAKEIAEAAVIIKGSLYQLDIPDSTLPFLLDWDRPLSQQTPEVRKALERDAAPGGSVKNVGDSWFAIDKNGDVIAEFEYEGQAEQEIYDGSMQQTLATPGASGREIYDAITRDLGSDKAASEYLASIGIVGNRYLDGQSRNRPLKDIKREFLEELPEDADFAEVSDLIGTGRFSPKNDALLKALRDDDWLGFDYPAQAISAALSNDLNGYDASPALLRAVEDAKEGATFNFVIWHQPTLDKIAMLERNGEKLDAMRDGEVRFSRKNPKRFNLEPETSVGEIQRKLQDNANVIKEVQNAIKLQGGKVTVSEDVYHAMERMTDTAAWRMETFVKETVEPLMKRAAAIKTNTEEIGTYLMALGAKDRNAYISTIRQDMPNNGSGMEDSEAQTIVDDYKQRPDFAEFDKLARDFQAITERKLNLLIDGGVITEDQAAEMKDAFGFYVPYKGFETVDEAGDFVGGNGIGSGYSTSKRMSKRAYGRISRAADVVENIIRDYNGAIFLAEKAKVGETLERLVDANPDSTLWTKDTAKSPTLGHTPTKYEIQYKGKKSLTMKSLADAKKFIANQKNKGDFTIQRVGGDPKVQYRDLGFDNTKEVRFIRYGKDVRIQIHHPLFIAAYNKLNNAQLNAFLEASSSLNSFLRQMYTQKNPVFIFKNAMRDVQTGYMVLTGEQGNEFANKSMLRVPKSFKNLLSYAKKGTTGNAVEDAWYKKMREWGGGNSFAYMEDVEAQKLKLEELLAKHGGDGIVAEWKKSWATQGNVLTKVIKSTTNASKLALYRLLDTEVLRAIENVNMSVENAIRLSAFREYAERNGGLNASNEVFAEASRIAKNVTVNFNRKGEFTPVMNSLYLFWNANVQGTQNIYRSATDTTHKKQVQAIMAGLAAMGFLMGMATGDDDDELSSEFDKHHNALIHAGDSVWKIPLAYGLGFFFGAGYTIGNLVRGRRTYGEATLELAGMALEHFSPLGTPIHDNDVDVRDVAVMASPTIFKPLTMSAVNKNTFGTALVPHYSETDKKPDSETMYRATRGTLYDQAANNVLTKWADVSPETLKMLTNYMTGGVGGIVADSVGIVANPAINMMNGVDLDEGFDVEKLPVLKSFHSVQDVEEKRGRFYKQLEDADDKLSTKSFVDDKGRKHKGREARIRGRSLSSWRRSMSELRDAERDARSAREFDKARRIEEEQVRLAESLDKSTR